MSIAYDVNQTLGSLTIKYDPSDWGARVCNDANFASRAAMTALSALAQTGYIPKGITSGVGEVASVAVTAKGSGYTSAPTVAFTPVGATPTRAAIAHATESKGVLSVAVDASGSSTDWTTATVVFTPTSGGSGAAGTATISGTKITAVVMTASGSGYITAPTVSFVGDGSVASTAIATISGMVQSVVVDDPGEGYSQAPTVSFTGGAGTLAAATATITTDVAVFTAKVKDSITNLLVISNDMFAIQAIDTGTITT